ncbi:MAG: serine hydrolase domain-containing protein [Gemmatimonadota bacterium]
MLRLSFAAGVVLAGCQQETAGGKAPIDHETKVLNGLRTPVVVKGRTLPTWSLADRMAFYKLPGVSIAIVDSGRIVWARGFGVKVVGGNDSVTAETLFEAGSISKPVAQTAMLRLVEQGKLSLDEPVNTYLKSWKLPDNKFTVKEKVTLRRIASHNAGLTVHGFPGYSTTDSIPTVPEVLDGKKPRVNTPAVRVDTFPGAIWRYSGGGTTIMQLILMDVTGKPFPALLKELVLDPAGMTHSTYEQPIPAARIPETSGAHHADGTLVPGRWHVYPEMAAAGLWTTPTDLLNWAMEIAADRTGKSNKLLSKEMATQMLTVQKSPTGLGPFLEGSGRGFRFGHGGADEGFYADLLYFPETGQGAAVMINGDSGPPILGEIMQSIGAAYGWPDYGPKAIVAIEMDSTAFDKFVGVYKMEKPMPLEADVTREGTTFFIEVPGREKKTEIVPTGPTAFAIVKGGSPFEFKVGKDGLVTEVVVGGGNLHLPRVK